MEEFGFYDYVGFVVGVEILDVVEDFGGVLVGINYGNVNGGWFVVKNLRCLLGILRWVNNMWVVSGEDVGEGGLVISSYKNVVCVVGVGYIGFDVVWCYFKDFGGVVFLDRSDWDYFVLIVDNVFKVVGVLVEIVFKFGVGGGEGV